MSNQFPSIVGSLDDLLSNGTRFSTVYAARLGLTPTGQHEVPPTITIRHSLLKQSAQNPLTN